jgi:hypothetical protein
VDWVRTKQGGEASNLGEAAEPPTPADGDVDRSLCPRHAPRTVSGVGSSVNGWYPSMWKLDGSFPFFGAFRAQGWQWAVAAMRSC